MSAAAPALRKAVYKADTPVYVTVDTSPTGIGWVINQEDEAGTRFPTSAKVLRDCISDITMSFMDNILIKGCPKDVKDGSIGADGCWKFLTDHVSDCEKIQQRLKGACLTFSGEILA